VTERFIPIADARRLPLAVPASGQPRHVNTTMLHDGLGRPLHDLRISVTDRCNFRCSYCMPKEVFNKDHVYLPHSALLSFEEIVRLATGFVRLGVQKIRLTGGEPLLRKNIEHLVAMLAALRTPEGRPLDLTLTTNGSLLRKKAAALREAGLQRLTVSLDGLDDTTFRRMNDVNFPVADVLDGIEAARDAGFSKIKVNMVVKRGTNDQEILPMAHHFKGKGMALRFIEYMDVGSSNGWKMDEVLPSHEVLALLMQQHPLVPLEPQTPGETAQRWGYAGPDGRHAPQSGEIGLISSVTQAFCGTCSRVRLSTQGQLYLCLFASQGHDLRGLLRSGVSDAQLQTAIAGIWTQRQDRYSQLRGKPDQPHEGPRVEMSYIGG
jgi:GTP 3',8-cyclase